MFWQKVTVKRPPLEKGAPCEATRKHHEVSKHTGTTEWPVTRHWQQMVGRQLEPATAGNTAKSASTDTLQDALSGL